MQSLQQKSPEERDNGISKLAIETGSSEIACHISDSYSRDKAFAEIGDFDQISDYEVKKEALARANQKS
jgi:hypothetical protein